MNKYEGHTPGQAEIIKVPVIPQVNYVDAKCPYCKVTTIGFKVSEIGTIQGCGNCYKKFELMERVSAYHDIPMLLEQRNKMLEQLKLHCELCRDLMPNLVMNTNRCSTCTTETLISEIEKGE
jgi:hypothetical protein